MRLAAVICYIQRGSLGDYLGSGACAWAEIQPFSLDTPCAAEGVGAHLEGQIEGRVGQFMLCAAPPQKFLADAILIFDHQAQMLAGAADGRVADQLEISASQSQGRVACAERGQAFQVIDEI